jgi:hypothetical protein
MDFIVGTTFGATVAIVSAYVVMRRWALADLCRVTDVARCVAGDVARRSVAMLVPDASQRSTVDLKPGVVPPLGERPTRVYQPSNETHRPRVEMCVDDVRSAATDEIENVDDGADAIERPS